MYPGVELRLYRYVAVLAEELNFTRAALRLHVAQPSLSKQIRELENYLGTQLFERTKRDVRLTAAGEAFTAEARLTLFHADRAVQGARAARGQYRGPWSIGYSPLIDLRILSKVRGHLSLVEMLRERKKHAPHPRWIFINGGGKPEGHFLEKFKRIALRAKANCGHCTAPWTEGRFPTRKIEVTCKTHPVCQHHFLHRLRKTCASNWEASNVPVRTIQYMLGHKSLETTQKYLGIANLDSLTDKIDAAAKVTL